MAQCSYIYATGLRIASGEGVVDLDGRMLRVVRDGKGKSRLDLALANPPSDGEISLKDLRAVLEARGESSTELRVRTMSADGQATWFAVDINPDAAMGRQGRDGDFKSAIEKMSGSGKVAASLYQLRTLPDSDKQAGRETSERLRLVVETAGGVAAALPHLDGRFGLLADKALLEETLAHVTAPGFESGSRAVGFESAEALIRVAGTAIGDPSRVSDEYFNLAAACVRGGLGYPARYDFLDSAFERLDDAALIEILRQTDQGNDIEMLLKQGRLERLVDIAPDMVVYHSLTHALTEDEWRRVLSEEPELALGSWQARSTLLDPALTPDGLFRETVLRNPASALLSYETPEDLASLGRRFDTDLFEQATELAPYETFSSGVWTHLDSEKFSLAVGRSPQGAIQYAPLEMTKADFYMAVKQTDMSTLTDEQLNAAASAWMYPVFEKGEGLERLSDDVLRRAVEEPGMVTFLFQDNVASWLNDEIFSLAADKYMEGALWSGAHRLTSEQLDRAIDSTPGHAIVHAAKYFTPEQLDRAAQARPDDAMAHAYKYLTPEQRERAVEASPSSAKYIPEKFRSDDEMMREAVELLREARELADEKRSAEREQQE
jgi:hypothetical protein